MSNNHILLTVCYLRSRGELLGILMKRFTADEIVDALGLKQVASSLGVM